MHLLQFTFHRTGETSSECAFDIDGMKGTIDVHEEVGVPEKITCVNIRVTGGNIDFEKVYDSLKKVSVAVQAMNTPKAV